MYCSREHQASTRLIQQYEKSTSNDHFAKICPNISDTEKEQSEQIEQMLNLEEDKTALKVLAADTYEDLIRVTPEETIDHLK